MSAEDNMKKAVTSFVAAAFLMANIVDVAPAQAFDDFDFGSSQVLAGRGGGRSGGRVGGRSSAARAPSRPSSSSSSTRVIERTTIVQPRYSSPSVIMAQPMYGGGYGGGYGYNPMPGLGLSLGLNAIQNSGNNNREYRQEGEIRDTKNELERSKMREADMEGRLRQMEMQQQQMLMMQQSK